MLDKTDVVSRHRWLTMARMNSVTSSGSTSSDKESSNDRTNDRFALRGGQSHTDAIDQQFGESHEEESRRYGKVTNVEENKICEGSVLSHSSWQDRPIKVDSALELIRMKRSKYTYQ